MKNILTILLVTVGILNAQTSDQMKRAKDLINKSDMSELQIRSLAKSQGYTDEQINEAILKDFDYKERTIKDSSAITNISDIIDFGKSVKPEDLKEKIIKDDIEKLDDIEVYFGYDIFKQDPALFQTSSVGSVNPDYIIGPGDEIIVMLWGETQFRQVLTVDREGFVFIPDVGQVFVNGLNLNLLESKLFRVLSQFYASLSSTDRKPTTFFDVSLGKLRNLRIQVLGEVAQPGAYTVNPSTSLFSALYYFNGPTTLGSLRDIRLIRYNEEIASVDYYDYLLTGKKPNDQKLQLDDIIFIPKRLKTVVIKGEVNRVGIFELKPDENLKDLIAFAGDLKPTAYVNRAQIDRIIPFENRNKFEKERMFIDLNLGESLKSKQDFPIKNGDIIQVFSILDSHYNIVYLEGAVNRPGKYDIGNSLRLRELIMKADSLLGDAYMDRVHVVRTNSDFSKTLIRLDLEKVLKRDLAHNIILQGQDLVHIYRKTEIIPQTYVTIDGIINIPGDYNYKKAMTVKDLILEAGGVSEDVYRYKIEVARIDPHNVDEDTFAETIELTMYTDYNITNINNSSQSNIDSLSKEEMEFDLLPYDYVSIRPDPFFRMQRKVTISGAVYYPGDYALLNPNETITDMLHRSGGLRSKAYADASILIRNERIIKIALHDILKKPRSNIDVVLQAGDKIIVAMKPNVAQILGEVSSPGIYKFIPEMHVNDYISMAGGFSMNAEKKDVWITFPDGQSKRYKRWFSNPIVKDGSIITIGKEVEKKPFDVTEFAKEIASILADLAQVAAILTLAN